MKAINKTSRVPFAVSLTLIFSYGLLQIVLPPSAYGTQHLGTPVAAEPDVQLPVEWVTKASHTKASAQDARPSVQ